MKIQEIEGIGPVIGQKFEDAGIKTVEALLEEGASKSGRKKLADATGLDESRILTFVNMADLFRINGVGKQFAELLVKAGVDTVKELKMRRADNLHAKLIEVNEQFNISGSVPALSRIETFIEEAKVLEPKITH